MSLIISHHCCHCRVQTKHEVLDCYVQKKNHVIRLRCDICKEAFRWIAEMTAYTASVYSKFLTYSKPHH